MADVRRRFPQQLSGFNPEVLDDGSLKITAARGGRVDLASHADDLDDLARVILHGGGELELRAHPACVDVTVTGGADLRALAVSGENLVSLHVEADARNQGCNLDVPTEVTLTAAGGPFRLTDPRHVTATGPAYLTAANQAGSSATGRSLTLQGAWDAVDLRPHDESGKPTLAVVNGARVETLTLAPGPSQICAARPGNNRDSSRLTVGVLESQPTTAIQLEAVHLTVTDIPGPVTIDAGELTVASGGSAKDVHMVEGTTLSLAPRAVATDVRGQLQLAAGRGAHLHGDPDEPPLLAGIEPYGQDDAPDDITVLDVRLRVGDGSLSVLSGLEASHRFSPAPTVAEPDLDHGEAASHFETLLQLLKRKHASGAAVVHAGWWAFDHRRARTQGVDSVFLTGYRALGYGYRLRAAVMTLLLTAVLAGVIHQAAWSTNPHTATFVPRGGFDGWSISILGSILGPINFLRPSSGWSPPGLGGMAYSLSLAPVTAAFVAAGAAVRRRIGLR